MLKIDCKKHKIYCSSLRELPFSSRSWTLYLNLRSIASASRPDSHPYLLSRSRERAGADYDKEDGGRENKTGWSGLRPKIHQMQGFVRFMACDYDDNGGVHNPRETKDSSKLTLHRRDGLPIQKPLLVVASWPCAIDSSWKPLLIRSSATSCALKH